jgi:hypothetical protein
MVHFTQFDTDEKFTKWQSENDFQIHAILPVLLNTKSPNFSLPSLDSVLLVQEASYGVMVTWSESSAKSLQNHMKLIRTLRELIKAWEKGEDVVVPMNEAKALLTSYGKLHGNGEKEQAQQ